MIQHILAMMPLWYFVLSEPWGSPLSAACLAGIFAVVALMGFVQDSLNKAGKSDKGG